MATIQTGCILNSRQTHYTKASPFMRVSLLKDPTNSETAMCKYKILWEKTELG
jgi:hypothetical protein